MTATFGKEFRDLRKQKGKTLADVAEALGISVGQLSNIERGKVRPLTNVQCITVAKYLKCSYMDMMCLAQQEHRVWDRAEKLAKTLVARAQTMPDWMFDALEKLILGPVKDRQGELQEILDSGVEPEVCSAEEE
jgi:transcriptional regulator with XRE-family HTH domain